MKTPMKILTTPVTNDELSLIEYSNLLAMREDSLDITYTLIDNMNMHYKCEDGYVMDNQTNFIFDQHAFAEDSLVSLAGFITACINSNVPELNSLMCSYDDRLTDIVNNYISNTTFCKISIDSFNEDIVELMEYVKNHTELTAAFEHVFASLHGMLSYSFQGKINTYYLETFPLNIVQKDNIITLKMARQTPVIYLSSLSTRSMFKDKLFDNNIISDRDSDLFKQLDEACGLHPVFNKINKAHLIVLNTFTRTKHYELYRNVDGAFVIATKIDY